MTLALQQECPRCHQRAISFWRKLIASETLMVTCSACGARVYTSFGWTVATAIIGGGAYATAQLYGWGLMSWLILAAGIAAALGLVWSVPLREQRNSESESKVER